MKNPAIQLALLTLISCAPGAAILAQEATDAQIEQVVVTAQRRSESLQNVPISAQVLSGDALMKANVSDLEDVSRTVPGVHISHAGATSDLYIRGIGSGNSQSFDQSVGTFIDDIYHGRARSSTDQLFDLDRIEILKGPQSTFFGNNAIAGAFNIVTHRPTDSFGVSARALYGMFGQFAVESSLNLPIADQFSVRFAGLINGGTGWIMNNNTHDKEPREYDTAGRITLAYRPVEDFDATMKFEASRDRQIGDLYLQVVNCPPSAPFKAGLFCSTAITQHVPTYSIGDIGDENSEPAGGGTFLSNVETVLSMNYHVADQTLSSVSGYYRYNYRQNLDISGSPLALATIAAPEQYYQFSQEFRIASPTQQTFEYLAGVYFQTGHLNFQQEVNYPFFDGPISASPALSALVPYLPITQGFFYSQPEHLYSAFGSLTLNMGDFKFTAGLREEQDEKTFSRTLEYGTGTEVFGGLVPLPASVASLPAAILKTLPGTLAGDRKDTAWMPSAKIQYQISPTAMSYASYSRGFKAGGFNGSDTTGNISNMPFSPEHVNAYEVGIKTRWLDDTVLLNLDYFRSDYTALQVVVEQGYSTGNGVAVVRNAAASRSQGLEFEGQWVLSKAFRLSSNVTYLHSRYLDYKNAAPTALDLSQGIQQQDLSGAPTEYAPNWSGSVTGTFSQPLPGGYVFYADLTPFFTSGYYLLASEDFEGRQPGYVRLDARLSIESSNHHFGLDLIGKNLTNRQILGFSSVEPTSAGTFIVNKEMGANVAIQARVKW